jgi:hypothetical protein
MSLFDSVMKQLGNDGLSGIAKKIGAGEEQTSAASGAAVTTLLSALARNARSNEGAAALKGALERDHDGGVLDDLSGFLENPAIGNGDGILGHILGARRSAVESSVGKAAGLDKGQTGQLLATLAPIVMGALGKQSRGKGLDATALAGLLGGEQEKIERVQPGSGKLIGALLDTDGDGDVDMSDLAKHGKGLLGRFLKR